jgi:hypothetical protein
MSFHDDFAAAGAPQLVDVLGEPTTYTPAGGAPRPLTGIVYRQPPAVPPGGAKQAAPGVRVFYPYSADPAVGLAAVDQGGDRVDLPERPGGATRTWSVVGILSRDNGGWLLKLG